MRKRKALMVLLCGFILVLLAACGGGGDSGNATSQILESLMMPMIRTRTPIPKRMCTFQQIRTLHRRWISILGGRTIRLVSWYDESIQGDNPDTSR